MAGQTSGAANITAEQYDLILVLQDGCLVNLLTSYWGITNADLNTVLVVYIDTKN